MHIKRIFVLILISAVIILGTLFLERCKPKDASITTVETSKNDFVGDKTCQSCHTKQHQEWEQSHHYMAMQPANDSTVSGNFNNAIYSSDGVTTRFFKKDGKFMMNTQGEDGNNHDYEVKYIFGFTPLQQYLIEFPGGRMQVPRVSWDVIQKKWFHQYPGQKIHSKDWLHWTGNAQNWNTMCASCHSTNLQKNYDIETDSYRTTYSVINVSCESCHGAGKLHQDYIAGEDYQSNKKIPGSLIKLGKNSTQNQQLNSCAPCHARKSDISATLVDSDELMDNYIPQIPDIEFFHADGQQKDEDYIYSSFLQSKMFRHGVTCSNCHNSHSGKTILKANATCLQCHTKTYDEPSHTFHKPNSTGASCVNCHMPGKLYMGNDLRYDHSLRVPRPDLSVKYGTPNACNNCHTDKQPKWASDAIIKWFGPSRKYHFSEDLIPGSQQQTNSEAHLIKLYGDTAVPNIVKATAVNYLGKLFTSSSLNLLTRALKHEDAQIRYRALSNLDNFPKSDWIQVAGPLLTDQVRAVRIAAADLFVNIPEQEIPGNYFKAFTAARNELQNYLAYQADFSVGNIMIADYYMKMKDYDNAVKYYIRGLKKDSLMNYGRLNLSTTYNLQGKNDKAMEALWIAAKIDPQNDRIFYNMALLYNEMNNKEASAKSFEKAIALNSKNPKVYYNYALLLNENKKFKEAEKVIEKAIAINPSNADFYYVLTLIHIQTNNLPKAKQAATLLKQLDPGNPTYGQIFKSLGI